MHWFLHCVALVALCVAPRAGAAVSLSAYGRGEALLFPYATNAQGNVTRLVVENTAPRAKAVKFFLRSGGDGALVEGGTAYLPARAAWTLAISEAPVAGFATLRLGDEACLPVPSAESLRWLDPGPVSVEVIEIATLSSALSDAVSQGCAAIWERWEGEPPGRWQLDPTTDIEPPRGELAGTAVIAHPTRFTRIEYAPLAFRGLASRARHADPAQVWPTLRDLDPEPDRFVHVTLPGALRLRYPRSRAVDALSALLASARSDVAYDVEPLYGERTDLVIGLPFQRGSSCEPVAATALPAVGAMQAMSLTLCGGVKVLKLRHPAGGSPSDLVAGRDDDTWWVGRSGNLQLDFGGPSGAARVSAPDIDRHCWSGLPAWVLSVRANESLKRLTPPRTYAWATPARGEFRLVPCG